LDLGPRAADEVDFFRIKPMLDLTLDDIFDFDVNFICFLFLSLVVCLILLNLFLFLLLLLLFQNLICELLRFFLFLLLSSFCFLLLLIFLHLFHFSLVLAYVIVRNHHVGELLKSNNPCVSHLSSELVLEKNGHGHDDSFAHAVVVLFLNSPLDVLAPEVF